MGTTTFRARLVLASFALLTFACSKQEFAVPDESQNFSSTVRYNNKVDIVMVMDNSTSMLQYQNKFAIETPGMINALNKLGLDYHISVVTTDMRPNSTGGKFVGSPKYLTPSTSGLVSILQSRVVVGQAGSDLTRGLDSMRASLQPSYLAGEGAGFFRDDALLAVIVVTNGDDYSTNAVSVYEQFLDQLKPPFGGGTKAWTLNFIGVTSIAGNCTTMGNFKEAGLKYMSVASYSGGVQTSICENTLTTAVNNVKVRIVEILSEYYLNSIPNLSTLQVLVNGNVVPKDATNGWTYDAVGNGIVFHGTAQPGASDVVKVNYTPAQGT